MTKIPGERRGTIGYADIGDMLRARVARGELRPGDRLVPVRELAGQLRVNVTPSPGPTPSWLARA